MAEDEPFRKLRKIVLYYLARNRLTAKELAGRSNDKLTQQHMTKLKSGVTQHYYIETLDGFAMAMEMTTGELMEAIGLPGYTAAKDEQFDELQTLIRFKASLLAANKRSQFYLTIKEMISKLQ